MLLCQQGTIKPGNATTNYDIFIVINRATSKTTMPKSSKRALFKFLLFESYTTSGNP